MNEDKRRTEHERREAALSGPTSDVELEARQVPAREIRQMLSVPMEPQLIRELRSVGLARGIAVSDLLREAAAALVERERRRTVRLQLVPSNRIRRLQPFLNCATQTESRNTGLAAWLRLGQR